MNRETRMLSLPTIVHIYPSELNTYVERKSLLFMIAMDFI
jgi:hypothetical protein